MRAGQLGDRRDQLATILDQVHFIRHSDDGHGVGNQGEHGAISGRQMRRVPQPEHDIHFGQGSANATVQPLVHLAAVLGLKARCVHEYKLRCVCGQNAA